MFSNAPTSVPPPGTSDIETMLQRLLPGTPALWSYLVPVRRDWATVVCFSCGKPGHGVSRCPQLDITFPYMLPGWSAAEFHCADLIILPGTSNVVPACCVRFKYILCAVQWRPSDNGSSRPKDDRSGVNFSDKLRMSWNAPKSFVYLNSPGVVALDTSVIPNKCFGTPSPFWPTRSQYGCCPALSRTSSVPRSRRSCGSPGIPRYAARGYDHRDCASNFAQGHEQPKD